MNVKSILSSGVCKDINNLTIYNIEEIYKITIIDLKHELIGKIPECLSEFINLKELYLDNNDLKVIENLDNLINLEELYLSRNNIEKIEGLDNLKNLKIIDLAMNKIIRLENLNHLNKIEKINLSSNKIETIEKINNFDYLKELLLKNNHIQNVKELENLLNIKNNNSVNIDFNPITSQILNLKNKKILKLLQSDITFSNGITLIEKINILLNKLDEEENKKLKNDFKSKNKEKFKNNKSNEAEINFGY